MLKPQNFELFTLVLELSQNGPRDFGIIIFMHKLEILFLFASILQIV